MYGDDRCGEKYDNGLVAKKLLQKRETSCDVIDIRKTQIRGS